MMKHLERFSSILGIDGGNPNMFTNLMIICMVIFFVAAVWAAFEAKRVTPQVLALVGLGVFAIAFNVLYG